MVAGSGAGPPQVRTGAAGRRPEQMHHVQRGSFAKACHGALWQAPRLWGREEAWDHRFGAY